MKGRPAGRSCRSQHGWPVRRTVAGNAMSGSERNRARWVLTEKFRMRGAE
jgi:hypothetical protein